MRPLQTWFPFGSTLKCLTLPASATRRTVLLQKYAVHHVKMSQLKHRVSGSLSLPSRVLFYLPSQYYALSVTKGYLGLRGGPRSFIKGFSCLDVLWIPLSQFLFRLRGFHPLSEAFPKPFLLDLLNLKKRSEPPECTHSRFLTLSFARRYFGNR